MLIGVEAQDLIVLSITEIMFVCDQETDIFNPWVIYLFFFYALAEVSGEILDQQNDKVSEHSNSGFTLISASPEKLRRWKPNGWDNVMLLRQSLLQSASQSVSVFISE